MTRTNGMTKEEWSKMYPEYAYTWDLDEHPDGHDEPCMCATCRSYAVDERED